MRHLIALAALSLAVAACDQPAPPTAAASPAGAASLDGTGYGIFAAASAHRVRPTRACGSDRYRDFDFWVGDWNVLSPTGAVVATNRIVSDLDGCAVLENWTAGNGTRGRSLNAYDRTDGKWHQMWVAPSPFSPLRIEGVKADGVMELAGVRTSPFGFSVTDTIRWQQTGPDVVNQAGTKDITGGFHSAFSIDYHRAAHIDPAPEAPAAFCQAGGPAAENRLADFLAGDWNVRTESGLPLARSHVEPDLSGCLYVERIRAPFGLESITFFHYDAVTDMWTRGTVDNLGDRLEMTGPVDHTGGPIVLTGARLLPGGASILVRLTIAAVDATHLTQTLQTSTDGGMTWSAGVVLVYER